MSLPRDRCFHRDRRVSHLPSVFVAIINDLSTEQSERQDPDFRPRSRRASEATAKTRCASSLEPKLKLAAKATYTVDSAGIEDGVNSMSMQEGKNATTPSIGPTAAKAEVTQVRPRELTHTLPILSPFFTSLAFPKNSTYCWKFRRMNTN